MMMICKVSVKFLSEYIGLDSGELQKLENKLAVKDAVYKNYL
jgi:hypothetical protein